VAYLDKGNKAKATFDFLKVPELTNDPISLADFRNAQSCMTAIHFHSISRREAEAKSWHRSYFSGGF
jgi:hypothetical protein